MPLFRCASTIILLVISIAVVDIAQTEKTFPNDDEFIMVPTQNKRTRSPWV